MMVVLCLSMATCAGNSTKQAEATPRKDGVEVLYFHTKQRCATCVAIERETKAVVNKQFANALSKGTLSLRVIDITQAENEALADKYEVTWSSLIIVKHTKGKEQAENLTRFAFANARNNPEVFRRKLSEMLNKLLD